MILALSPKGHLLRFSVVSSSFFFFWGGLEGVLAGKIKNALWLNVFEGKQKGNQPL